MMMVSCPLLLCLVTIMIVPRIGGTLESMSYVAWIPPPLSVSSSISSRRRWSLMLSSVRHRCSSRIRRRRLLHPPSSCRGSSPLSEATDGASHHQASESTVVRRMLVPKVDGQMVRKTVAAAAAAAAKEGGRDEESSSRAYQRADPAKPAWVEDPYVFRVKKWIRAAGRKRDHERVVMYLRKFQDGRTLKGKSVAVHVYNAALKALDECHRWQLALTVFREMQAAGVAADRNSYFFTISACSRRGEARTALQLLSEMTAAHARLEAPAPDLLLYGVAVKACAHGRAWRQALRLVEDMSAVGVKPNIVVLNTALSACAKCGQTTRATDLLRDMEEMHGVTPDAVSYNCVINAYERTGEWREALALYRTMEKVKGVSPTVCTFNSVIGACKTAKRPTEALAVLSLMRRRGLKPDVISFNSAISACARKGVWKTALQLLETMPGEGVQPNLTTYNAALDACAKSGQWEMALSLFKELSNSSDTSLVPDLYTYNTVMTVYSRSGMLARALELLEEMKALELRPDVVTYSTVIRACERALPPQPDVALRLLSHMETAGVKPNNTTFVSVLLSLGRAGRCLECLEVLKGMSARGTPPDAVSCQTVLRVLDRWDRPKEAFRLFKRMQDKGLATRPEVAEEAYCCGIRALERLGRWSSAVSLLEEWRKTDAAIRGATADPGKDAKYDQWYRALNLLAMGGSPGEFDPKTARAAMVAAARGGLGEQALVIMRNMEAMGLELGVVEYGAAMEAFEKDRKPERSLELFDEMIASDVEPDILCFAAASRCSRVKGDWATSIRLLETALRNGLLPNSNTFQTASRLCAQLGKFEELWALKELMREMVRVDESPARPGSAIYVSLMRACGGAGRPDLILRCLAEMNIEQAPGKDWRKQALEEPGTLSAAVGALYKCNETTEADRIYGDGIRRGILPNPASGPTWTAAAARAATAGASGVAAAMSNEDGRGWRGEGQSKFSLSSTGKVGGRSGSNSTGNEEGLGDLGERKGGESPRSLAEEEGKEEAAGGVGLLEGCEAGNPAVLWVDVRRAPVEVIPAVVRRVALALEAAGGVSDGLVVEWAGGLEADGDSDKGSIGGVGGGGSEERGGSRAELGGRSPRSAARAGRREMLLEAFAGVEPAIEVVEPSRCRGQIHIEKRELHRWLQVRDEGGGSNRRR